MSSPAIFMPLYWDFFGVNAFSNSDVRLLQIQLKGKGFISLTIRRRTEQYSKQ